jgi:hypothetical protein
MMNSKKPVKVTTWASPQTQLDLAPGRWVQLGGANWFNYFLTGLPGGKVYLQFSWPWLRYQAPRAKFSHHLTGLVNPDQLEFPRGFGPDGYIKGILGQRKIRK